MKTRQMVKGNFEIEFYDEEPFTNKVDAMASINHTLNTGLRGIASLKLDNVTLETESEKCSKCFWREACNAGHIAIKNCDGKAGKKQEAKEDIEEIITQQIIEQKWKEERQEAEQRGDEYFLSANDRVVRITGEDKVLYNKLRGDQQEAIWTIVDKHSGNKETELSSAIAFFSDYEKQINSCFFNYSLPSFDFIKNGLSVAALINNYYIDKVKKETLEKQTAQKECQNVKPDTEEELTHIDHVTISTDGVMIGELGDEYEDLSKDQKDMITEKTALYIDKLISDCI